MAPTPIVAKSALIVPFLFASDATDDLPPAARARALTARGVTDRKGKDLPFWSVVTGRSKQILELDPAFRSLFSVRTDRLRLGGWTIEHLRMPPTTMERFFGHARLARDNSGEIEVWAEDFRIEAIDLVLFPLDVATLVIRIDWLAGGPIDLDAIAARLDATRHFRAEQLAWSFGRLPEDKPELPAKAREAAARGAAARRAWFEEIAGPQLGAALDGGARTGLDELARWLVAAAPEDQCRIEFASARYTRHQTALAVDSAFPDEQTLSRALFHTRRAATARYVAPEGLGPDVVLSPRANRRIALSREGTVSISWPPAGVSEEETAANVAFERDDWPLRFVGGSTLGIYLLLCLHVRGQHVALQRLAERSLRTAEALGSHESLEDEDRRGELVELARAVAQYSLTVASGDCGGVTEYSLFFRGMRGVLGVEHLLTETRAGVTDLLELVDTVLERSKADRDRQFQTFATELGIVAVAFATVGGIMGANVPDLTMLVIWLLSIVAAIALADRLIRWRRSGAGVPERLDVATFKMLLPPEPARGLRRRLDVVWPGHPFPKAAPRPAEREPATKEWVAPRPADDGQLAVDPLDDD